MAIYSVYLPPDAGGYEAVEKFRLLRDAKAPFALIFPPAWLAWHRLWLELLVYIAISLAIVLLAAWKPLPPVFYLSALPGLYLLLEGNELIRLKLERNGWEFAGIVDANNHEEAEIKFLTDSENTFPSPRTPRAMHNKTPDNHARLQSSVSSPSGIFPE